MKSYEPYWTPAMVQAYLEDAADVMKALPRPRVQGYFSTWPDPVHDFWDAYGWTATENHWRPTARQISQMEYVCEWIRVVSVRDGKIIWRRACRVPWKVISSDLHTSRTAITNWYNFGIGQIVAHLNAQDPDGSLIKRQG